MELSLKIELTDRRNSGESRALFNILFLMFCFFFYFFSTENLGGGGGPERSPERGPEGGPEGGSRKGGPRFVYTQRKVHREIRENTLAENCASCRASWFIFLTQLSSL